MNHTISSPVNTPPLTFEYLQELMKVMDKIPKIPCGIVCKPSLYAWCMLNLTRCPEREAFGLGGIPLYVKFGQEEDYIEFYDHEKLRAYLSPPSIPKPE